MTRPILGPIHGPTLDPTSGPIPLDAALAQARGNRFGRMTGRSGDNRIEPECWPHLRPSFHFSREQSFFVIGSCFAHHLGRRLIADGYTVLYGAEHEGLQRNRYTPAAIWQELAWAHAIFHRDDTVTEADIAPLLLEVAPGRWSDLWSQAESGGGVDRAAVIARRKALYAYVRGAFVADVAIVTLGLIEAWHDTVSDTFVDFDPGWARRPDRARFRFERLDFTAAKYLVEESVALLADGRRKVLLTTSPVVLARTFTGDDVIVANAHSKAVLRAVAGEVAAAHPDVDYFPSYEIATITRRPEVWEDDLVHINPNFVARIMRHVTAAYAPGSADETAQALLRMAYLVEGLKFEAAEAVRAAHAEAVEASTDPAVQIAALRLLVTQGRGFAAVPFAQKLAAAEEALGPRHPDWIFDTARVLVTSEDPAHSDAGAALLARFAENGSAHPQRLLTAFVRLERLRDTIGLAGLAILAEDLDFVLPEFAAKVAAQLLAMGQGLRALAFVRRHLAASPEDAALLERCTRIELASGDLAAACATLEAMVRRDPRDVWAAVTLARTLVKRGEGAAALAVLEALDREVPDHPPALALAARLLWKARRREEAGAIARRALAASGNDPAVAAQLAGILAASA